MHRAHSMNLYPHNTVILVTGGFGFLGLRLQRLLTEVPNAEVILVSRNKDHQPVSSKTSVIHGDLGDESFWQWLPERITHVFHLAAEIPSAAEARERRTLLADNLRPISHLVEQSRAWSRLRQVIYTSSVSVYGPTDQILNEQSYLQPKTPYGTAKLLGENLLSSLLPLNIRTVSLRLSSLYGVGQNKATVLPIMVNRAINNEEISVFGDGSRTQDFLHVDDAARALMRCFQKEAQGTYNVGAGTPTTMLELAQTVSRVFNDTQIVMRPEKADGDPGIKLDVTKIKNELEFEAGISLEAGLKQLKSELNSPEQ